MQIVRSLSALPPSLSRSVLAIGNFDGVHRGHQAILHQICQRAAEIAAKSVAVTFDPHPVRILRPEQAPKLITPLAQKLDLLAATGIDATGVIPFTPEFSTALRFSSSPGIYSSTRYTPPKSTRATISVSDTTPAPAQPNWPNSGASSALQ